MIIRSDAALNTTDRRFL